MSASEIYLELFRKSKKPCSYCGFNICHPNCSRAVETEEHIYVPLLWPVKMEVRLVRVHKPFFMTWVNSDQDYNMVIYDYWGAENYYWPRGLDGLSISDDLPQWETMEEGRAELSQWVYDNCPQLHS